MVAWAWWRSRQPSRAWLVPALDLVPKGRAWWWSAATWCRLVAGLLAVGAASGPRVVVPGVVPAPGALMVVLDTSASMAEPDMPGANGASRRRLDAAVDALVAVMGPGGNQPGWNAGLVGVAGRAEVISPPVPSLGMLEPWLRGIQPVVVPGEAGTDLASGLVLALGVLEGSAAPAKAVLLVSDGENNASPPESGLSLRQWGQVAKALGIACHSLEVAPSRGDGPASASRALLEDLARLTGGQCLRATQAGEAREMLEAINRDWESRRLELGAPAETALGSWLALAALAGLVAAWAFDRVGPGSFPVLAKSARVVSQT